MSARLLRLRLNNHNSKDHCKQAIGECFERSPPSSAALDEQSFTAQNIFFDKLNHRLR